MRLRNLNFKAIIMVLIKVTIKIKVILVENQFKNSHTVGEYVRCYHWFVY